MISLKDILMYKPIKVAKITVETTSGPVVTHAIAPNEFINLRDCERYAKQAAKKIKAAYVYFDVERMTMRPDFAYQACKDYSRNVFRGV